MDTGAELIIMGVFGAITAAIAASKGRTAVGWFFIGFFFSCLGLILVLCLSDLNEEQARWAAAEQEQRRLREQLKQERLKSEAYRAQANQRLDLHDQALGINTLPIAQAGHAPARLESDPSAEAEEAAPAGSILPDDAEARAPGPFSSRVWTVDFGSHRSEAFRFQELSFEELKRQFASGQINEHMLVRSPGMPEWQLIVDMTDLLAQLTGRG